MSAHFLTGALHDLCPMDNGTGTRRALLRIAPVQAALESPFTCQQLPHFHHQRLSKSSRLPGYFSFSSVSRVDSVIIGAYQRFVNCFFHKNK